MLGKTPSCATYLPRPRIRREDENDPTVPSQPLLKYPSQKRKRSPSPYKKRKRKVIENTFYLPPASQLYPSQLPPARYDSRYDASQIKLEEMSTSQARLGYSTASPAGNYVDRQSAILPRCVNLEHARPSDQAIHRLDHAACTTRLDTQYRNSLNTSSPHPQEVPAGRS